MDEWRLFWVGLGGTPKASGGSVLERWTDLSERETELKFRTRQPILLSPEGRVDPRLSGFFRLSKFSAKKPGTQETYAPDYRLFFTFLWRRGLDWDEATADDLADWEDWRLRGAANPRRIGGARWKRELAALKLLYGWAVGEHHMISSPVSTHQVRRPDGTIADVADLDPSDVKYANVKWLTPAAFRKWRNVGLGGMLPSGLEDESFRGRNDGRDMAFADLLYSSGLRRREGGSLLVSELPHVRARTYYPCRIGTAVAKRAGRFCYISHSALQSINGYQIGQRAKAVRRAQARGLYERLPDRLIVESFARHAVVRWRDVAGAIFEGTYDTLDFAQRARLFVRTDEGLEPAMLWLTETGMPFAYKGWSKVFERGSDRCAAHGLEVYATPHMLRHSMALRMLISLNNTFDRRYGLTPEERRRFAGIYDGIWGMVRDLLGHASEDTTKNVYCEPVRGLQLESLLNDDENPVDERTLSEIARKTGLILDVA